MLYRYNVMLLEIEFGLWNHFELLLDNGADRDSQNPDVNAFDSVDGTTETVLMVAALYGGEHN